jgi:hypothetical protein
MRIVLAVMLCALACPALAGPKLFTCWDGSEVKKAWFCPSPPPPEPEPPPPSPPPGCKFPSIVPCDPDPTE